MKCPFCNSVDTQVIDSRVSEAGDSIRRRRRCMACQKRFTTYENVELRLPQVVKSDGSRADFDERKIRVGFQRALHKRPVPTEYVDAAIQRKGLFTQLQYRPTGNMEMYLQYGPDYIGGGSNPVEEGNLNGNADQFDIIKFILKGNF